MKKLLSLILVLALLLGTAALADEQLKLMDVEQLPGTQDVRLYINAVEPPTEDNLTVNMNGAPLRSPLTVQTASDTGRGTVYVFCMDVSGTIAKADIDRACQELVDFCNKLGPSDLMRVYIIGSEATPMCDYTADPAVIESALAGIPRRTSYTYLWKGIQMAADDLVANRDRLP